MKAHFTLTFALLLICTGAVLAQTPDGETPAEETVCDNETGAAFGLCNAYCEAMDCESDDPQASDTACSKVRAKFQQTTGRDLPCEAPPVTCPCFPGTSLIYGDFISGADPIRACTTLPSSPFSGIRVRSLSAFVTVFKGAGTNWICNDDYSGFFHSPGYPMTITEAEAQACIQHLEQLANSKGLTCTP
ncbi:MAG TPA: hypothetical protein VKK31_18715 [Thermoanaerobaculia bacterium]|nr:hypothetical protein [Thermoanaerobaculia bacterium]